MYRRRIDEMVDGCVIKGNGYFMKSMYSVFWGRAMSTCVREIIAKITFTHFHFRVD